MLDPAASARFRRSGVKISQLVGEVHLELVQIPDRHNDVRRRTTPATSRKQRGVEFPAAGDLKPMLSKGGALPQNNEAYAYEIKWDGVRAVLHSQRGKIDIVSRNVLSITHRYPELQQLGETITEHDVVLDGEIIATDEHGRPSFSRLQERMGLNAANDIQRRLESVPVIYMIFDILYLDGRSLIGLPYHERRRLLEQMELVGPSWQTPPYFTGEGSIVLDACRQQRLEGLIAKKLSSKYEPGRRSGEWLKVKVRPRQEFVIGGWLPGEGAREGHIGSLLVGYFERPASTGDDLGKLHYAGRVGTGFSDTSLMQLEEAMRHLASNNCPFGDMDSSLRSAVYVDPILVGEVEFAEWTHKNTLRQPSFKGLRMDKDPGGVIREKS